ncbi:6866_t:CDS:2 [Funneliformis geosporum]|uniref:19631_t:CDS:1 n=1 Tax=Funneliformis geosporum TaxID=1117311 RepID=A0A9W4SDE5_9GLOM|nr:19631_t:CDS:2 [Funneliformis geosporum]CAI2178079.1 6866_t:CDS:2 [Funneliformis geosporum]
MKRYILFTSFFICSLITTISAGICYDNPHRNVNKLVKVQCEEEYEVFKRDAPKSPDDSMFEFTIECISTEEVCIKVKNEFEKAGKEIAKTIRFNTPVKVIAAFHDFCDIPEQTKDCQLIIGQAGATRFISMKDDDGINRLYPQPLVKQFQFEKHPKFTDFDIFADFNANTSFWFEGDPKIQTTQVDFKTVVVHEMIHGLGFFNAYSQYTGYNATIPLNVKLDEENSFNNLNEIVENGMFLEFAMDKYTVLLKDGTPISYFFKKLNSYFVQFNSTSINTTDFINSPQFKIAEKLYELSITPLTIGVLPKGAVNYKNAIPLETSITEFNAGSTLGHVDFFTFYNTADFLMVASAETWVGLTAQELVKLRGNYAGGLIGPKLKLVLENLGYATDDNPNPYKPTPL